MKRNMMHNAGITLLLISGMLFASCGSKPTPPPAPTPVNLDTVKAAPVVYYDRFPSTTVALMQVNLLAQVQGYLTGILFKEGSHVTKGQPLYDIDSRIYENAYQAANANLKQAQGTEVQSQEDADRYTYLNNQQAVAKQLYDHAIITLQNSKSAVQGAAESLKTARQNLDFAIIKAPFSGTIGFSQVKLGDLMSIGTTVLNTISSDDPMGLDFLVNEKQLVYFENIQSGKTPNVDSLFTLIMPDNSFYPHQGTISVIDRAVDPQTGTVRVRLIFPNPDLNLRAGMSCVLRVRNQDNKPQIVIPNRAIVEQMGEYFVFVAKDTTMPIKDTTSKQKQGAKDSTKHEKHGLFAFQKKVMPGATIGPNIVITGGLEEGQIIVVDGIQSLHDGSQITTSNTPPGAQQGKKEGGSGSNSGGGGGKGSGGSGG